MIYPLRLPRLSHICSRMPSSGSLPRRRRPVGPLESQVPVGTLLPPQHVPAQEETRQGGVSLVVAGLGRGRPTSGWLCTGAAVCAEQQLASHATAICPFPMEHSRHSHSIQGEGHQIVASNQDDEPPQSHKLQGRGAEGAASTAGGGAFWLLNGHSRPGGCLRVQHQALGALGSLVLLQTHTTISSPSSTPAARPAATTVCPAPGDRAACPLSRAA